MKISPRVRHWPWEVIILTVAALATRTWQLAQPNATVFDEVYFKDFASRYFTGHYYFDIHPPLGKLLLAGWAHLVGLNGTTLVTTSAWQVRLLPAVAGALLVPIVYGIVRRLGQRRLIATLAAAAILFDNALTVESRFILIDSMLLAFGFAGIYFALVAAQAKRYALGWWALAGLFAGAAASTKWTGLTSLVLVAVIWIDTQIGRKWSKRRLAEVGALILIPVVIYVGAFWIHFRLLPDSGTGDAFMSTKFQATLVGSAYYDPTATDGFWSKFVELNHEMYEASATLKAGHPYASPWYKWPLEIRPIYYWEGSTLPNGNQGNIYLLGNPAVWWPAAIGVATAILAMILPAVRIRLRQRARVLGLLLIGYGLNYLPFLGIKRVMFLYHYFFAFIFSVLITSVLVAALLPQSNPKLPWQRRRDYQIVGAVLIIMAIGFWYFSPLTYGTPISPGSLKAHDWLSSWR